jgi:hypothetical protein
MDKNWTKIFSGSSDYNAELIKGMLNENDIEAIIINKQDSAYHFGEIELYVKVDQVMEAKRLLNQLILR